MIEVTLTQAIISVVITLLAGMASGFGGAVLGIRTIENDLEWMKAQITHNIKGIKHTHARMDNHIEKFHSK